MEEKIMQFANFNITFGNENQPMLDHFEDVIYPAFTGGYIRGKKDEVPRYSFSDVKIKELNGEYVLVGNYIKDTEYKVITTVQKGNLISSPAEVPTAPFSRFIIFLKNHRMVLVRNEKFSPDVRSFQKTVREILSKHINTQNRGREKEDKLPIAIVHIVDIPLKDSIEEVLKGVQKINFLKMRFFPLNNDLDPNPLAQAMRENMKQVGSKTGNLTFNTPGSKKGVKEIMASTGGLAVVSMKVTDDDGETRQIKEDAFSSNKKIPYSGNLSSEGDPYLVEFAQKDSIVTVTSAENASLYERVKGKIKRLMEEFVSA